MASDITYSIFLLLKQNVRAGSHPGGLVHLSVGEVALRLPVLPWSDDLCSLSPFSLLNGPNSSCTVLLEQMC